MSVARTWAVALTGLRGEVVEVEADVTAHQPDIRIIGLADRALGEAARRVGNACENSGLPLPYRRLTVNLSPAGLPKQGTGFDLAIAVAALATDDRVRRPSAAAVVHLGELGLDGRLRPVAGVLPAVRAAVAAGRPRVIVPWGNREEAELVVGAEVWAAVSLAQVAAWHGAEVEVPDVPPVPGATAAPADAEELDLADVVGQQDAVEALIVAAAGGHHLLMSGPSGAGKTMLARRLPGILPPLDDEAALEVASVRSLAGEQVTRLDRRPPFEAPHHSASTAALIGGGSRVARPGAIARASRGVLFIDEATEAAASTLDALRQPLEQGSIDIHRAGFTARFPARFQLVLAKNPCPCGEYGVRGGDCTCSPHLIRRYAQRLSGPLLDRIDIDLKVERIASIAQTRSADGTTSAAARSRVTDARARSRRRLAGTPWQVNVDVPGAWLRRGPRAVDPGAVRSLDAALQRGVLTLRGYDRVLRVAWTVADLAGHDRPTAADVGRALFLKKGVVA
ncbi:YifB family Mg chelatase-like AAA ATPase [Microbacterium oryzae]|uniref:ATP-binding protein n=1 Tax=Microbacterium oryzae TaxID=743009 RepID=A0A6I6DPY5_9MICO|nr:YifB family Mg chelatase-like AAA ATPase [Microbacterium oryzae]QGU26952.1 ATP-binding protein [Microbacterium oryzae]